MIFRRRQVTAVALVFGLLALLLDTVIPPTVTTHILLVLSCIVTGYALSLLAKPRRHLP